MWPWRSIGVYWKPVYYMLQDACTLLLVNVPARDRDVVAILDKGHVIRFDKALQLSEWLESSRLPKMETRYRRQFSRE